VQDINKGEVDWVDVSRETNDAIDQIMDEVKAVGNCEGLMSDIAEVVKDMVLELGDAIQVTNTVTECYVQKMKGQELRSRIICGNKKRRR